MMIKRCVLVAVALCIVGASGCQNALTVRVELLKPKVEKAAEPGTAPLSVRMKGRYARRAATLQAAVNNIKEQLTELDAALQKMGYTVGIGAQFPVLDKLRGKLSKLEPSIQAHVDKTIDPTTKIALADLQHVTILQNVLHGLLKNLDLKRLKARIRQVTGESVTDERDLADSLVDAIAGGQAAASQRGFGGFRSLGVHQINPGDPVYQQVVDPDCYEPSGVFSQAYAAVNGDSTIVFVQETPTQIRFFELDSDPSMLIQNILYITDKVLQAVVKYAPL